MDEYQMRLVGRREIARQTMAFSLDPNGAAYDFRAGQHADFAFLHPSEGDKTDNSRTFSLASSPSDKGAVMIAMRMRETGFKTALKAAPLGTMFEVSRPRGSFTLHKDLKRPAVFLAGGIGITPMHSILHTATQLRLPQNLYLFYSNRQAEDAGFLKELEDLAAKNRNFMLVPTITREGNAAWPYARGPIDRGLLTEYLHALEGPVYYVAGPSRMVAAMTALLRSSGVSEDDIKTEEFGDYKSESQNA